MNPDDNNLNNPPINDGNGNPPADNGNWTVPEGFDAEMFDENHALKQDAVKAHFDKLRAESDNYKKQSEDMRRKLSNKDALASEEEYAKGYKNDDLGDPLINAYHAIALKLATKEEIEKIKAMAFKVNDVMKEFFAGIGLDLVDFKLEFGRLSDGEIVLADEISPDTCRFWDSKTHEKLDKDRFRRDLGNVEDAYNEMMKRIFSK